MDRDDSHLEYEEYESHHDFENDSSGKCNLIVNYLPHDIDDISLKVWFLFIIILINQYINAYIDFIFWLWRNFDDKSSPW